MRKLIEFRNIVKTFDGQVVLKGVNLNIYENEFVTLLGPSGCGKTTLLRILGGFLEQDEGTVIFDGQCIDKVPPYRREINTVFQRYALFPHLNVYENIAFGLRIKKTGEDIIRQKVSRMLSLVNLEGYEKRKVTKLSGGQQQRVAIARALVNEPNVLLLDEPLGALDLKLRKEMQRELKRIQQEVGITFIYVTHDQEEALTMSDKIVVMNAGEIKQIGTPLEIYNEPVNAYVARFIGESNIVDGIMKEDYKVRFDDKNYECVDFGFRPDEPVDVLIRPEDIAIVSPGKGVMRGEVKSAIFKGVHYELMVDQDGRDEDCGDARGDAARQGKSAGRGKDFRQRFLRRRRGPDREGNDGRGLCTHRQRPGLGRGQPGHQPDEGDAQHREQAGRLRDYLQHGEGHGGDRESERGFPGIRGGRAAQHRHQRAGLLHHRGGNSGIHGDFHGPEDLGQRRGLEPAGRYLRRDYGREVRL